MLNMKSIDRVSEAHIYFIYFGAFPQSSETATTSFTLLKAS